MAKVTEAQKAVLRKLGSGKIEIRPTIKYGPIHWACHWLLRHDTVRAMVKKGLLERREAPNGMVEFVATPEGRAEVARKRS